MSATRGRDDSGHRNRGMLSAPPPRRLADIRPCSSRPTTTRFGYKAGLTDVVTRGGAADEISHKPG